ncbi:hydroxymethylglutaryl-CoA lyase [Ilyonectria robusta]
MATPSLSRPQGLNVRFLAGSLVLLPLRCGSWHNRQLGRNNSWRYFAYNQAPRRCHKPTHLNLVQARLRGKLAEVTIGWPVGGPDRFELGPIVEAAESPRLTSASPRHSRPSDSLPTTNSTQPRLTTTSIMSLLRSGICRACRRSQLRWQRGFATAGGASYDNRVKLVEVGPRDGLQNEKKTIPLATKIELIERLARTGVSTIEAGSFVSPKWVPQVRSPGCQPSARPPV